VEGVFTATSLVLFGSAFLIFAKIVYEAYPYLDNKSCNLLKSLGGWNFGGDAIQEAWTQHVSHFPHSRKRAVFAAFLIAAALSVMGYPVWLALSSR